MLTAGADRTGRATAEVRPHRRKMGRNRAVRVDRGGRRDDDAAADAIIMSSRLPVAPKSGYSTAR
jgi:hypothetical protein